MTPDYSLLDDLAFFDGLMSPSEHYKTTNEAGLIRLHARREEKWLELRHRIKHAVRRQIEVEESANDLRLMRREAI